MDRRGGDMRIAAQEVIRQSEGKILRAIDWMFGSEGVDRVLHRVGRDDLRVVTREIGLREFAFKRDIEREFDEFVAISVACDFG